MRARGVAGFTLLASLLLVVDARAQSQTPAGSGALPGATDSRALAEMLFFAGRGLMEAGRYAEACAKLSESYRLDPASGTLLNLGVCHQKEGKIASAWGEFRQALGDARKANRADREKLASEAIAQLEPELPFLTLVVPEAVRRIPGLVISRNGVPLNAAAWNTELPADPGEVEVEERAPDYKPIDLKVKLARRQHATLTAEPLVLAPIERPSPSYWTTERTIGAAVFGAAVLGGRGRELLRRPIHQRQEVERLAVPGRRGGRPPVLAVGRQQHERRVDGGLGVRRRLRRRGGRGPRGRVPVPGRGTRQASAAARERRGLVLAPRRGAGRRRGRGRRFVLGRRSRAMPYGSKRGAALMVGLVAIAGLLAVAACQLVAGVQSRTLDPEHSGCTLPSGAGPQVRVANFVPASGAVDVCLRATGSAWGEPILLNGGTGCGQPGFFGEKGAGLGFAYGQISVAFAAPGGTVDVKMIAAGGTCSSPALTEANGVGLSRSAVTTLARVGGNGVAESLAILPEAPPSTLGGFELRFVNAMPGIGNLDLGTAPIGGNTPTLPTTVATRILASPVPFGHAPAPGTPALESVVNQQGYFSVPGGGTYYLVAGVPGTSPENAVFLLQTPPVQQGSFSIYAIGVPHSNQYFQEALLCQGELGRDARLEPAPPRLHDLVSADGHHRRLQHVPLRPERAWIRRAQGVPQLRRAPRRSRVATRTSCA